jgi:hypothetical protein
MWPVARSGTQGVTLFNTKAMLFIDHYQTQVLELDGVLKQGMSANHDLRLAVLNLI